MYLYLNHAALVEEPEGTNRRIEPSVHSSGVQPWTDIPTHVDSPMAIHATRVLLDHPAAVNLRVRKKQARGRDPLGLRNVHLDMRVEDSKALNDLRVGRTIHAFGKPASESGSYVNMGYPSQTSGIEPS